MDAQSSSMIGCGTLSSRRIQVDEICCYVQKKQRHMTLFDDPLSMGDTLALGVALQSGISLTRLSGR
jgi:hypothetical protein